MPRYPLFIGGSYTARSPIAAQESTVNWYVEPIQTGAKKNDAWLAPTPGEVVFGDTTAPMGTGGPRGIEEHASRVFLAIGSTFMEVSTGGAIGYFALSIGDDGKPVSIVYNGTGGGSLCVVSNGDVFRMPLVANVLIAVAMPHESLPQPRTALSAASLDGYIFVLDSKSTVWQSGLLDVSTFAADAFLQRSVAPDPFIQLKVLERNLWLFGEQTSEIWYNAETYPFTLAPHPSGLIRYGCAAAWSPTVVADSLFWLARTESGSRQVVRGSGFQAAVVSDYALDAALEDYEVVSDAVGFTYLLDGHQFYVLSFPTANATWAYDITTGVWSQRGHWNSSTQSYDVWRPIYHAYSYAHERNLTLDLSASRVLELDVNVGTHADGSAIRRERRAPSLSIDQRLLTFDSLEVHLEAGIGATANADDHVIELQYSNDGGKTFVSAGTRTAGAAGDYHAKPTWHRLGTGRDRVFKLIAHTATPWRIIDAYVMARPGTN